MNIGDTLECRVAEIDAQGRINLVRNDIKYDNEAMPVRLPRVRTIAAAEIAVDADNRFLNETYESRARVQTPAHGSLYYWRQIWHLI